MEDPRTEKIADAISNKTARKIVGLLAERKLSESELARKLNIPLNTVEYNIKNLEETGLIEKVKGFLWSARGKRIFKYKVSNKKIIISPRSVIRGVIPAVLISGVISLVIKIYIDMKVKAKFAVESFEGVNKRISDSASEFASASLPRENFMQEITTVAQSAWLWFFAGALSGLFVYLVRNWWKKS